MNWKVVETVSLKAVETANWRAVVNWKAVETGTYGFVDPELKDGRWSRENGPGSS